MKIFWLISLVLFFGLTPCRANQTLNAGEGELQITNYELRNEDNPKSEIRNPKSADLTVAADGTGDVKTVREAIEKVPENNKKRFVIFIKPGVYKEQIR